MPEWDEFSQGTYRIMSHYSARSSKPSTWAVPRQSLDPHRRRQIYGAIQPMEQPSWLDRILRRR